MKPVTLLLLLVLLPALSFCQTIVSPAVGSTDDPTTSIVKIETAKNYTAVVFKHVSAVKDSWFNLNKAIYLQDVDNGNKYNYLRSAGIATTPQKQFAAADNEEAIFTVYFEKLKPGVKTINIIESAVTDSDKANGDTFFNYYKVSLTQSDTTTHQAMAGMMNMGDTSTKAPFFNGNFNMGALMTSAYTAILDAQLQFYADKAKIARIAKIDKDYYDALIKEGFTADQAIKIITSTPLISAVTGAK